VKKVLSNSLSVFAATSLLMANAFGADVDRSRLEKTFVSPNGVRESCVALAKLPMGAYKASDAEEELRLCSLDFYNNSVALCPKTWSTSPGTMIQSFQGLASSSAAAEASLCKNGTPMKTLSKFKQTMNQQGTSGTFSGSSIMYYHLSRALDTSVTVPIAVYRSMDKAAHNSRVTAKAHPAANARMNIAGWDWIRRSEASPEVYRPTSDLFTADHKQIYGVLLKDSGERYGMEVNGTRASGWGDGQNFDFQKTPGFMALKTNQPLVDAINTGYSNAVKDGAMAKAFASGRPSVPQMVLWMNELSEIALMDFIFSQQDRVGNVDYKWYWTYVDSATGEVKAEKVDDERLKSISRLSMSKIPVPAALAGKNAILVQKTSIGDNDAGGLVQYANFARRTGMLDGVAGKTNPMYHFNKDTYSRLIRLARDFKARGENYQTLEREIRIAGYNDAGDKRFAQLINNTVRAADLLEANCKSGVLKLDLVSFKKAVEGDLVATNKTCTVQ
jgi:hypothetical protein